MTTVVLPDPRKLLTSSLLEIDSSLTLEFDHEKLSYVKIPKFKKL